MHFVSTHYDEAKNIIHDEAKDLYMTLQWYHNEHHGVSIVYSTICSGADQRKHHSSMSLAFARGIYRWPVNSPHIGPVIQKMFPFDDVIMFTGNQEHLPCCWDVVIMTTHGAAGDNDKATNLWKWRWPQTSNFGQLSPRGRMGFFCELVRCYILPLLT